MHFSLNPQLLVQSNLGHFSNFSSNRSFCSISGLSCPTCILGTGASSSESVLFLSGFNIQHGSCCLFFFFSSESVTAQKPQSSTSKTACLSFIGLLALHLSHECHSRFHRTGAGHPVDLGARSQGQEREGALLLNIWWGAAEAFVFPCIFLLGADLTLSISLTCLVTNNNQEKLST